jgi:hypothetical protein
MRTTWTWQSLTAVQSHLMYLDHLGQDVGGPEAKLEPLGRAEVMQLLKALRSAQKNSDAAQHSYEATQRSSGASQKSSDAAQQSSDAQQHQDTSNDNASMLLQALGACATHSMHEPLEARITCMSLE